MGVGGDDIFRAFLKDRDPSESFGNQRRTRIWWSRRVDTLGRRGEGEVIMRLKVTGASEDVPLLRLTF